MRTLSIYVDSSVWNVAFDAHAPQLQSQTLEFFRDAKTSTETLAQCFISDVVLVELGHAPAERQSALADLLRELNPTLLQLDEASRALANAYISNGVLRSGHLVDAQHVAVATVAELDVLTSWNYRHLVNRRRRVAFNGVNGLVGYRPIEIISPPEVFDE